MDKIQQYKINLCMFGGRIYGGQGEGKRRAGAEFPTGASNQISLMKWAYDIKPIGSETTDILSYVS